MADEMETVEFFLTGSLLSHKAFMEEHGKDRCCLTCGFLSTLGAGKVDGVLLGDRNLGTLFNAGGSDSHPHCYLSEVSLIFEFYKAAKAANVDTDLRGFASRAPQERIEIGAVMRDVLAVTTCDQYVPWREHLSPEWHWEHKRMMDIERMRSDFTEQLEKDRRDWTERLAERQAGDDKREKHFAHWIAFAAIILGLFQLASAFLAPVALKALGFSGN